MESTHLQFLKLHRLILSLILILAPLCNVHAQGVPFNANGMVHAQGGSSCNPASGSVAYISDADATPATGTSIAFTSFATSGTCPVIVVAIGHNEVSTVSSIVCSAGLTCTAALAKLENGTAETGVEIWCLANPSGTGTITVILSSSTAHQANAILMQHANDTTACATGDTGSATGSTNPLSVTPPNLTANDAAVGMGTNCNGGDAPTFNQTQTFNNNTTACNAAGGYHLGTGAVTVTWGSPTTIDVLVGIRVKP